MTNSLVRLRYLAIALILTAMVLPTFSAKADQVFVYSDDLNSSYKLDMSQTSANLVDGRAFTADNSVSSSVVSNIIEGYGRRRYKADFIRFLVLL